MNEFGKNFKTKDDLQSGIRVIDVISIGLPIYMFDKIDRETKRERKQWNKYNITADNNKLLCKKNQIEKKIPGNLKKKLCLICQNA